MKKKITALFLCVALAAIAIVGASLAYFSDTDNKTNTFTVGGVKIDLIDAFSVSILRFLKFCQSSLNS